MTRRYAQVGANRIAYLDEGDGPTVLLLHGCPFSSFVWRRVIASLIGRPITFWFLPAAIGLPLLIRALHRHPTPPPRRTTSAEETVT